jgi:hypothetical protein
MRVVPSAGKGRGTGLCVARRRSLVLDPLENLFPMDRDILRCINADADLGTVHAKDRHDDVRTDPDDLSNSPRKY